MASGKPSKATGRAASKTKQVQKTAAPPSTLSTEFVEETSDDDDGSNEDGSPAAKTRTSQKRQKSLASASPDDAEDSAGGSEDEVDATASANEDDEAGRRQTSSGDESTPTAHSDAPTPTRTGRQIPMREARQATDPDDAKSGPDSAQSSATEDEDNESVTSKQPNLTLEQPKDTKLVTSRTTFRPPRGFTLTTIPQGGKIQSVLTTEALAGKQLWHIVAPAEVPMSSISTGRMIRQDVKGSPTENLDESVVVASHKGTDYQLLEDNSQESSQWVYIPRAGQSTFAPTKMKITRNVRLRQDPSSKTNSQGLLSSGKGVPLGNARPAPTQPSGLKMRYQPFGVATSDHISRVHPSTRPGQIAADLATKSPEKRKARPSMHGEVQENPLKKHKNRHKEAIVVDEEERVNGVEKQQASKKHSYAKPSKSRSNIENGVPPGGELQEQSDTAAVDHGENEGVDEGVVETPEERAKRKADKKRIRRENETPEERERRRAEKKRRKQERAL